MASEAPLDQATRARLSRLGTTPVDTTRLDAALRARIPRSGRQPAWRRLLRPVTAVAASLTIVAVIIAAILATSGGEAVASPAQMAQVHRDILANRIAVTKVNSIDEAGRVLSQSNANSPALPHPPEAAPDAPDAPDAHVMACCMKSIQNKNVACVLLQNAGGTPITMSVARSGDMRPTPGGGVRRGDFTYQTHSVGPLNMVMTERNGRMVCLMAELPSAQLIDLASKLRF
jgi:hypothetical protein